MKIHAGALPDVLRIRNSDVGYSQLIKKYSHSKDGFNGFAVHLWWHKALFRLEALDVAGVLRLIDLETLRPLPLSLPRGSNVTSVKLSADGSRLAPSSGMPSATVA